MEILETLNIERFKPPRGLGHPLAQTIIPYYIPTGQPPTYHREFVTLTDGDQLALALSRPPSWQPGQRIVVLFHGLAGCETSSYLVRVSQRLYNEGFFVIRCNLRSCGPGQGLAQNPYHSGRSEDSRQVLQWVEKRFPKSPITQVGFSLSANITLKMLGEDDSLVPEALDSAMAISPPLNLKNSAFMLTKNNFKIFNYFFLLRLKKQVRSIEKDFPELDKIAWPKKMDLIGFDHIYTAPRSGYADAFDYYEKASCLQFIEGIRRPTLNLLSKDDPVVDTHGLETLTLPESVKTIETEKGGHVGFLEKNRFWMDEAILRWVKKQ